MGLSDPVLLRKVSTNLHSFMKMSTLLLSTGTKQLMKGFESLEKEKEYLCVAVLMCHAPAS